MYVSFPHNSCGKPQPVLACHLGHYIDLSNLTLLWGLSVEQLYTYVFFLLWTCLLSGYLTDSILTLKGWSCVFSLPYSLNLVCNSDLKALCRRVSPFGLSFYDHVHTYNWNKNITAVNATGHSWVTVLISWLMNMLCHSLFQFIEIIYRQWNSFLLSDNYFWPPWHWDVQNFHHSKIFCCASS